VPILGAPSILYETNRRNARTVNFVRPLRRLLDVI
jgi:hypothetical protein